MRQSGRQIQLYFQNHLRYINTKNPQPADMLHILNKQHEYGSINDTMELLNQLIRVRV